MHYRVKLPELVLQLHLFKTDALMDQGPMRVKTGKAFLKGFADVKAGEASLQLPILLVASPTDKVGCALMTNNISSMLCSGCGPYS